MYIVLYHISTLYQKNNFICSHGHMTFFTKLSEVLAWQARLSASPLSLLPAGDLSPFPGGILKGLSSF